MPDPVTACSNCGEPVTTAGPRSEKRYCMRRHCQSAKARRNYRRRNASSKPRMERRPCSGCGQAMLVRSWRSTDLEEGRWCPKINCRRAKQNALYAKIAQSAGVLHNFATAEVVECGKCGRDDAKVMYWHPAPDHTGMCDGTPYGPAELLENHSGKPELVEAMRAFWPRPSDE